MKAANYSLLPVWSLLLAATMWGVFWYPLRWLEDNGLVGIWATFVIYFVPLSVLLVFTLRGRFNQIIEYRWPLLFLSLSAGWCNVAFILAVIEGNVLRVLLLFYLSPLWSVLFALFILKEPINKLDWFVIATACMGAFAMLWHPEIGLPFPESFADWLAISAGIGFALSNVLARKLFHADVRVKAGANWFGVIIIASIWIFLNQVPVPDVSNTIWLTAGLIGLLGMSVMTFTVVYGVTHLPVSRSAVILLFELVAGAISAYYLANELITMREWIGGAFVVLAGLIAARAHSS